MICCRFASEVESGFRKSQHGFVTRAMSMAEAEYVLVCAQVDTEKADIKRERVELVSSPEHEHAELTVIYRIVVLIHMSF